MDEGTKQLLRSGNTEREGGGNFPFPSWFSTSTVKEMQKVVLVLVPVLLALVAPFYAWSREGVSFALFGCALGAWACDFAAYWRGRRR